MSAAAAAKCLDHAHPLRDATHKVRITDRYGKVYEQDVCDECLAFIRDHRPKVEVVTQYSAQSRRQPR